jgi:hypothetical protein
MFETTVELFDRYYKKLDKENAPGFNRELGCEVRERLQQLDYLIHAVRERGQRHEVIMKRSGDAFMRHVEYVESSGLDWEKTAAPEEINPTREEIDEADSLWFEMQLFTECFYYFAGRLRTILRNKAEPLPELSYFECEGARNVRNKLLEHAEAKDSQVFIRSFGFGGTQGPVLKSIRNQGQESVYPDKGLYQNALEIKESLEHLINKALA